jgi:PmbA protein
MSEAPLKALAARAVELTLAAGADQADAFCADLRECSIRVFGGRVEDLADAGTRGVGVRALKQGRAGYSYGSDLDEGGLGRLAHAAWEAASVTDSDQYVALPDRCGISDVGPLHSDAFDDWGTERKIELALEIERSARATDELVSNVEDTVYSDSRATVAIANSLGFAASFDETHCYAYAYAFAGEGADRMTGLGVGTGRDPGKLDPSEIGAEAARRAVALHGARQPSSMRCPVVLDPFVVASFVGIVGSRLSADAVQRGRSLFAGKEGEEVASSTLGLFDDGIDPEGLASSPFDGEGVPSQRTELIRGGNLKTFLFDSYTARRVGRQSTGNASRGSYRSPPSVGATNLVVEAGDRSAQELIEAAADGVYVSGVTGLHSGVNPITGQFSVGASGRRIESGRLAGALREFTIASDLVSMLGQVRAVGKDTRWLPFGGSVKAAAMLIGEMTVGGR